MRSLSRRVILGVGLVSVLFPLVSAAQVPQSYLGTWKLNLAKSTYNPGPAPKSSTGGTEAVPGGGMRVTNDSIDLAGKPTHTEIVTMFDGKEGELKGAAAPPTRLYSRSDDRTYQYVMRVNGKVTTTNRVTISADGKTRTIVSTGTGTDGKPVNTTTVWDRQ